MEITPGHSLISTLSTKQKLEIHRSKPESKMVCSLIAKMGREEQVIVVSKTTIFPSQKPAMADLKLSVSDLPMLSCHYIQKGVVFLSPPSHINLIYHLKNGLSEALSHFPPLAGRLVTNSSSGEIFIACNDSGAEFIHAVADSVFVRDILSDRPSKVVRQFFSLSGEVSYAGHFKPIMAIQATQLADGVFIGCSVNHAVTDGTSFWSFFNTFADICRGVRRMSKSPDFSRDSVLVSPTAILKLPPGGPVVTFSADESTRERIFSFTRSSILRLKAKANSSSSGTIDQLVELLGKQINDALCRKDNYPAGKIKEPEVSSFQSLCALLWRCVTRARRLSPKKTTTFRMAVNCRHWLEPQLDPLYFGNAIQSIPTVATAGELLSQDLHWSAEKLRQSVAAHSDGMVRKCVQAWEAEPKCFPLGNFDGAVMTMGSSPRFPMYENDFGWGKPVAVRSGQSNKFDGKMSAFPGRRGGGSVHVEVVLCSETMVVLENDPELLQFLSC